MEKPGSTTAHPHPHHPGSWGEKVCGEGGGSGGGGQQHTQYIRRLVDLRDELLNQEETGLARALDRLRLHSINNREAAKYRLKIKDQATMGGAVGGDSPRVGGQPPHPNAPFPRPMLTTVEKFRQMRPQRRPPVIFPLQGKQLIESSSPASSGNATTTATTRSQSTEEGGSRADSSSSASRGVEDTVKANLQRLIHPTSSIPNIGRKALRQESLELKSQSLQNMRARVFKSTRSHLVSPFMMSQDEEEGEGGGTPGRDGGEGEFHLSPHAYKLGPMTDGDRINMDKLNQYYYIYCMPDTPNSSREEGRSLPSGLLPQSSTAANPGQHRGGGRTGVHTGPKNPRRTNSERSTTQVSRPFSDRSSLRSMVVSSDTEVETSTNPRYKLDSGVPSTERMVLPVIHDSGEGVGVGAPFSSSFPSHKQGPHDLAFFSQRDATSDQLVTNPERRKRHIVIDMPHIIFNAATPDIAIEASKGGDASPGRPLSERPGALSKTLKQNEIRQRELQNLLEDVKELNKRTETLNTQAQRAELEEPPASMLC
ncbi:hypothetical protein ACOMHN_020982 [Nucella lapillus]